MDISTYRKEMNFILSEISSNIEKIMKSFLDMFGITVVQYKILSVIFERKCVTIGELSSCAVMDAGNMSSMCKKLEKNGYIIRSRNIKDERIVEVSLTDKSKDIVVKLNNILDEKFKYFFENETNENLEIILKALRRVNEHFFNMVELLPNKKIIKEE